MSPTTRTWMQRVVVVAIWVAAYAAWRGYRSANDLSTLDAGQRFVEAVESAWWGIFAFVGVYVARPLVLFPASVLTVMAGVVFGPWSGVVVVIIGANASALLAYALGRLLRHPPGVPRVDTIGDTVESSTSEAGSLVTRWGTKLRTNSFETVFVMRLLFLPYDLVNYLCGALRVRWTSFLLATALGSLPGTISFVLLGASLERIDDGIDGVNPIAVVASIAIFAISIGVSRTVKRRYPANDGTGGASTTLSSPTLEHS